jgi:hypothetical protein
MVDRKVVPFDEFYYQLKLSHVFQKHPVYLIVTSIKSEAKCCFSLRVRFRQRKKKLCPNRTRNLARSCAVYRPIQGVTEISILILTSNRTRHDEQFFYVLFFPKRQFCLAFSPP